MGVYYGTDAFVLGARDYGEADRVVMLFTQELGRIDALVKGVRLPKSKLRGHLNQYSRARLLLTPGKEYWRLLDADSSVRVSGSGRLGYVFDYVRFFTRLVVEPERDDALWSTVAAIFPEIDSKKTLFDLKIRTLSILGLLPHEDELAKFFPPHAARYILQEHNVSIDMMDVLEKEFTHGIEKILAQSQGI